MDSKMSTLVGPIFLLKKMGPNISTLSGPIFLRRSKSVSAVKDCNFDSPISFKNRSRNSGIAGFAAPKQSTEGKQTVKASSRHVLKTGLEC